MSSCNMFGYCDIKQRKERRKEKQGNLEESGKEGEENEAVNIRKRGRMEERAGRRRGTETDKQAKLVQTRLRDVGSSLYTLFRVSFTECVRKVNSLLL